MSRKPGTLDKQYDSQRQRLLKDASDIHDIEEGFDFSLKTANETVDVGQEALAEIKRQNDALKDNNEKVSALRDRLKRGNRLLFFMILREYKIRIILSIVALVQILMITFLLYVRWINPLLKCTPITTHIALCGGSYGTNRGHCSCLSWP